MTGLSNAVPLRTFVPRKRQIVWRASGAEAGTVPVCFGVGKAFAREHGFANETVGSFDNNGVSGNQTPGREDDDVTRNDLFQEDRVHGAVAEDLRMRSNASSKGSGCGLGAVLSCVTDTHRRCNNKQHNARVDPFTSQSRHTGSENKE
jgi:hypothetical protein